MKEIIIDIPLGTIPEDVLPSELLNTASSIRFLRLDLDGFLFTCHLPEQQLGPLLRSVREHYRRVRIAHVEARRDGNTILRVQGSWWRDDLKGGEKAEQERIYSKFRALGRSQCYFLRSPEVNGKNLRISLVGDAQSVRNLQKTFGGLDVPYRVSKISELEEEDTADSPLKYLTATQMRVLRLAHAMGYYEIPRKTSTERLAGLLRMDKGTVGRHLRRAERHVVGSVMT